MSMTDAPKGADLGPYLPSDPNQQLVLITVLTLLCVLFGRYLANTVGNGQTPPVFEGLPFVGGLLKFTKDKPMKLMREGYAKFGEAFTVPVAHKRVTFLIGPDVTPHFFKATDDEMSQTEVYSFNVPTFGPGVVYDVDQKVRTEQFRWFTEALKKERMKMYVPQFVMEAEQYFANWGNEGVVDFKDEFSNLITKTAARTLLVMNGPMPMAARARREAAALRSAMRMAALSECSARALRRSWFRLRMGGLCGRTSSLSTRLLVLGGCVIDA